jgi:hypothetical protein
MRKFLLEPSYDPDNFISDTIEDPDPAKAQAVADLDAAIQQAIKFTGVTVGPVQPPSPADVGQLLVALIALKHEAAALGWLCGAKFIGDLDKTLERTNGAFSSGRNREARQELRAFIEQLSDQRKRQPVEFWGHQGDRDHDDRPRVTQNAYYLLTANAEYILLKIPGEARADHDDRHDDRRDDH